MSSFVRSGGGKDFFFFLAIMPCATPPPPPPNNPLAPCPSAFSRLCSHHNKPGADGALLCLADGDRQPLSTNSLLGNQLTSLDSARCFYHSSPPSVGRAGSGGSDRRGILQRQTGGWLVGWWVAAGWRSLCRAHHVSLRRALGLIGYQATNRCKQPPADPP